MLSWINQFNIFCFLDNQQYARQPHQYECIAGAGVLDFIESGNLKDLDEFLVKQKGSWIFGHLSYKLKEQIHQIWSQKSDPIGFAPFYFFKPSAVLILEAGSIKILADDPQKIFDEILIQKPGTENSIHEFSITNRYAKETYLKKIEDIQSHILHGDCYEINFCQEFFAENIELTPLHLYRRLIEESPNPFCAFYRLNEKFLICASPERFLMKQANRLISQPIKGTIKRDLTDTYLDKRLANLLMNSKKDRSENVMIVDLVRNDLSKICHFDTVKVKELFGIYDFPQVYHMISTIEGEVHPQILFSEIITSTFPMGSMTGAPKHRVMQLIDQYEDSERGIFSGSVGYIDPQGDFDLNVVIRSMMYNSANRFLSWKAGSGITFYSEPQNEWEECLLKASAIKKVLTG